MRCKRVKYNIALSTGIVEYKEQGEYDKCYIKVTPLASTQFDYNIAQYAQADAVGNRVA